MSLTTGSRVGPYEILSLLGEGGMGQVYRARDTRLKRDVAIKVLPDQVSPDAVERFQREAFAASALSHPHICAVHDVGDFDGRPYLVMELVEGQTLRAHTGGTPLAPASVVAIAIQIADALAAAHSKGVIHRDIKPGNIMMAGRHVKVLDFGLAKQISEQEVDQLQTVEPLTAAGVLVGTPQYMAPELLHGGPADVRSDLWSLGVVMYELLAGRPPFGGRSVVEISSAILRDQPPPLPASVPAPLRAIVARCLAKRPEDRYENARDVGAALAAIDAAPAPGTGAGRRWLWVAAAAVVAIGVGVFLFVRAPENPAQRNLTSTGAPASVSQEATDAFELAMQFGRVQNDMPKSGQMLERALAIDPHFAEARRYLAFNKLIALLNGYTNDTTLLYKAEQELEMAKREEPGLISLPSAFTALYLMQGRRELVPAAELDRVHKEHPLLGDTALWQAILALLQEDNATAKSLLRAALERQPLLAPARMFLGETLRTEGDLDGAIRELQKVLDQAPSNITAVRDLTHAYIDGGNLAAAHGLLESKRTEFGGNYMWRSAMAVLLAREGKRDQALATMDEDVLKFLGASVPSTLDAAEVYALTGETTKAIEWLERAIRNGDERAQWFRRNPRLASIQTDQRFQQMLASIETRRKQRSSGR
jgi:tetratricopeptide (TPR) repeat protein